MMYAAAHNSQVYALIECSSNILLNSTIGRFELLESRTKSL